MTRFKNTAPFFFVFALISSSNLLSMEKENQDVDWLLDNTTRPADIDLSSTTPSTPPSISSQIQKLTNIPVNLLLEHEQTVGALDPRITQALAAKLKDQTSKLHKKRKENAQVNRLGRCLNSMATIEKRQKTTACKKLNFDQLNFDQ